MEETSLDRSKRALLDHIADVFEEMENDMALSHQEKYALLEDMLENATDHGELQIAFEQWYNDHIDEVSFEHDPRELWGQAMARLED